MVFRSRQHSRTVALSVKAGSISVAIDEGHVTAWDLGGRLYSAFRHGRTWRRGLSGRVLHKWRDPSASPEALGPYDERQRVFVAQNEADRLIDEAAALARKTRDHLAAHRGDWRSDTGDAPGDAAVGALDACAAFDSTRARKDAARFRQVYDGIGILPPDQYMSVVLQATRGCSFGTCTFCDLYHDAYRVRSPGEFEDHLNRVLEYLGASLALRDRTVFLGAANALAVPTRRLTALLGRLASSPLARRPVHAFVDGFTGARKSAAEYRELAALGLRRVYIGLESGHDPLLGFVRKPGTSREAVETARAIKDAGIAVGVIVMVGLGGKRFAEVHVSDTIAALNRMALGAGDLLYFSDLVEVPGTEYPSAAAHAGIETLGLTERAAQLRAIRAGLLFPGAPPRSARYDIREFVY